MCIHCDNPISPRSSWRCEKHRLRQNLNERLRRAKLTASGLCASCGRPVAGSLHCPRCNQRRAEATDRLKEKYRSAGGCRDCGKPSGGMCRCEECGERHRLGLARLRGYVEGYWKVLSLWRGNNRVWPHEWFGGMYLMPRQGFRRKSIARIWGISRTINEK